MDKHAAPLFEALVREQARRHADFHVPGHKGGKGVDRQGAQLYERVMGIDATEITGLDDLHSPDGIIRDAQELAADCFGADETFFLVNGSTAGILAMILAVCAPDDLLIVQRNVHKSVIHGLALARAQTVFLTPRYDKESGLAASVSPDIVRQALERYPQAKGILVANPNYYGMAADLRPIAELAHQRGIPLLVDEAHGAHFGFHPSLPASALSSGADAAVQSTHKMLTAMTMGAMLHVRGGRIDREALRRALSMVQSSSPSYPILASLDLSRRQMHLHGAGLLASGLAVVKSFRRKLAGLAAIRAVSDTANSAYGALDPFKVTVYDATGSLTGFQLQQRIEAGGCRTELADERHVLLVFSLASRQEEAGRLFAALAAVSRDLLAETGLTKHDGSAVEDDAQAGPQPKQGHRSPAIPGISEPVPLAWNPRPCKSNSIKHVPLEEAAGFRSAEMVTPYPPGIPVLYPGERISVEMRNELIRLAAAGARFQGAEDRQLRRIRVYAEAEENR